MNSNDKLREEFYKVANRPRFIELGGELNDAIAKSIEVHADWWLSKIAERESELRAGVAQQIAWTIPIGAPLDEYVEVVKTGNMDKMYDYGFNKAKERFLALIKS